MTLDDLLAASAPKNSAEHGFFLAVFNPLRVQKMVKALIAARDMDDEALCDLLEELER